MLHTENTTITTNLTENKRNCSVSDVNEILSCASQASQNSNVINDYEGLTTHLVKMCWLQNPDYENFYNKPFQIVTFLCVNIIPDFFFLVGGIIVVRKLTAVKRRVASEQVGPDWNQQNIRADSNSRQHRIHHLYNTSSNFPSKAIFVGRC
jgi:hypothetical protein